MKHCCLDVETLSVPENCQNPYILSLGAMIFDDANPSYRKYFYRRVSSNQTGKWDTRTREFWESLSPPVRKLAGYPTKEKVNFDFGDVQDGTFDVKWKKEDPKDVLKAFRSWALSNDVDNYWANSPSFDCRIVDRLHESLEFTDKDEENATLPPWKIEKTRSKFWMERDVRTIKDIFAMFNLTTNEYQFIEECKKDWVKVGFGQIFAVKHFALFDATDEASMVYTVKKFLSMCKTALES